MKWLMGAALCALLAACTAQGAAHHTPVQEAAAKVHVTHLTCVSGSEPGGVTGMGAGRQPDGDRVIIVTFTGRAQRDQWKADVSRGGIRYDEPESNIWVFAQGRNWLAYWAQNQIADGCAG